ncbi:MAG: hypothetical protein ACM3XM_18860 [Mycobacterium leprae]
MSKKGERNQKLQPSKADKAYGDGYLPSVQTQSAAHEGEHPAQATPVQHAQPRHGVEPLNNG